MVSHATSRCGSDRRFWRAVAIFSGLALTALVGLEFTHVDLELARLAFDPLQRRFPWQDHRLTTLIGHEAVRLASAACFVWLVVGVWRPFGMLRRLSRPRRIYLVCAALACFAAVGVLKRSSALHCPWGIAEFGGTHAYLRLFEATPVNWSRGACFPAGHVLSAFAYIGGYFAWRDVDARIARRWLLAVLLIGGLAGLSQQLRGAHFLSHTLWTLWMCWTISAALAWAARRRFASTP